MKSKEVIFEHILQEFVSEFHIVGRDTARAWGAFALIDECQIEVFIDKFFPDNRQVLRSQQFKKLSPKILFVAPQKRLSWQYHNRRAEIWRILQGPVGLVVSETDEETEPIIVEKGHIIQLNVGTRHRLVGLDTYAVIAEIWKHTDAENPSNEDDIVRLQDDFGR